MTADMRQVKARKDGISSVLEEELKPLPAV